MEDKIIQIISAVIGSVGFALYFNIEKSKILSVAVGGFISWSLYLVLFEFNQSIFLSSFISALIVCIYCEIMARFLKSPSNIFLIPSVIPLLPGGSFYYTMYAAIHLNLAEFNAKGMETFITALAIALGIVFGSFIFNNVNMILRKNKEKKEFSTN